MMLRSKYGSVQGVARVADPWHIRSEKHWASRGALPAWEVYTVDWLWENALLCQMMQYPLGPHPPAQNLSAEVP